MRDVVHRETCRLCDSTRLELVLPILPSPIGDAFVGQAQLTEKQNVYPLDTYLCLACGHLQNLDIVDPEILFRNYTYRTSISLGLVEHFRHYADTIVEELPLKSGSLVVEIGSNDGTLLKAFKTHSMRVVGVDPARAIAAAAAADGVPTLPEFFGPTVATDIKAANGPASLICANNVFAHADNLAELVRGVTTLLAPDGVFVFEVSYVLDMIDNMVFDTIYHEHVSHHALTPLEQFLRRFDLTLFDVGRSRSKGGSIRGFAQRLSSGRRAKTERILATMAEEQRRRIAEPPLYRAFFRAIEQRKEQTLSFLDGALAKGEKIAAYGASTTTTTLLYHFELGSRIEFILDDNPVKQNTFSPGQHIPVLPSSEIYARRPDIVVVLAWIQADPIIRRHRQFIEQGGRFLIPLPNLEIVSESGASAGLS